LADRRLGAHPLADRQSLPEDTVEQGPRVDRFERLAHLTENLAFAGDERVEPGGDAEEMERRSLLVQPVEHTVEGPAGELLERFERRGLGNVRQIQLGAVARREADGVAERPGEL